MKYMFARLNPMLWLPESDRVHVDKIEFSCNNLSVFYRKRAQFKAKIGYIYKTTQFHFAIIVGGQVYFDKDTPSYFSNYTLKTVKSIGFYNQDT